MELEGVRMTAGVWLGSRMSRIVDGVADGSEGDEQWANATRTRAITGMRI